MPQLMAERPLPFVLGQEGVNVNIEIPALVDHGNGIYSSGKLDDPANNIIQSVFF